MKATLLIAEGDAELREMYQDFLTESGYDVETAQDGLDCLVKQRRTMPAVLVLDQELRWGGGDGVRAAVAKPEDKAPCYKDHDAPCSGLFIG